MVDLPHLLFDHLWTHVKETREDSKTKPRNWIPMGRLMSDILTEFRLVGYLAEAGQSDILKSIVGKTFDGRSLFRLKLVQEMQAEPEALSNETVRKKRIPVEDFPLFIVEEPVEILLAFIESCLADGTPLPPDLLEQASRPAPDIDMRKRRRKKKVSEEEGPQRKKSRAVKKRGISISEPLISESDNVFPTSSHVPSEPHIPVPSDQPIHIISDPPHNVSDQPILLYLKLCYLNKLYLNNNNNNLKFLKPQSTPYLNPLHYNQRNHLLHPLNLFQKKNPLQIILHLNHQNLFHPQFLKNTHPQILFLIHPLLTHLHPKTVIHLHPILTRLFLLVF